MAVRLRLRRTGRKGAPSYRIVAADSTSPRDGRFIEIVGQYSPRQGNQALNLKTDRVNHWLDNGALPTDTVRSLLRRAGILKARHETRLGRKLNAAAVPLSEKSDESAEG
jgi:small subunit ribosomal protein S16